MDSGETSVLQFDDQFEWTAWLHENHAVSDGVWLRFAKRGSGVKSITYAEALESALCYGWVDGQNKSEGKQFFRQRFTPRGNKSIWSKINRAKALNLIENGCMQPAGLAEIERARRDGRWEAAYDSPANATVPDDLQAALDANPRAMRFFAMLDSRNRYAILFRIHNVRKPETRARKIVQFVMMLEKRQKLYP